VLIHAADAGIVQDYVAYRNEHRNGFARTWMR
jgi:hypothetical protein